VVLIIVDTSPCIKKPAPLGEPAFTILLVVESVKIKAS
jgi:hypothetical protein